MSILGIILIVAVIGILLYAHFDDAGFSSLFSSASAASSGAEGAAANASAPTKTTTATTAASKTAVTGSDDSSPVAASEETYQDGPQASATTAASKATSTSSTSGDDSKDDSSAVGGGEEGAGLFGVSDDTCGDSGAVEEPVEGGGPNGKQEWLNCGLSKENPEGKWTPPHIEVTQLKSVPLDEALKLDIFSACKKFEQYFQAAGDEYDIPPILIVAIAMTESSCNPDAKGDNGDAWGLMQILSDKCGDAPSGNCADPEFNIKKGTEYFKDRLKEFGGSTLLALGQYNGWEDGMTYNYATRMAADQSTCVYQNNLDYFQTTLNGYMQGVDGQKLATVNNLAMCDDPR
ncbi:hypothetical protein JCM11251_004375 [Rhodosporidiobolus azoricus]